MSNSRLRSAAALAVRLVETFPDCLSRALRSLHERTGSYAEAIEVAERRVVAAFFQTTDFCNARCLMCGARHMRRKRQVMPMEIYRRAVAQLADAGGHTVALSGFAEPLLDPHLIQRVGFAKKFPVIRQITFSTNGSLLTAEKYRQLAGAGLCSMTISIDGFSREAYEAIRIGLSYKVLEKNMAEVLDVHEALGRPIAIDVSSFTLESHKALARSALYRRLMQAGIKPVLKTRADNWGGLVTDVEARLWLMRPARRRGPCAVLHDCSVLVLPDGRVTPCHCRDNEGDLCIGNVNDSSLLDLWRGKSLHDLRAEQWKGVFRPPCARCSAYVTLRSQFSRTWSRWLIGYNKKVPVGNAAAGGGR